MQPASRRNISRNIKKNNKKAINFSPQIHSKMQSYNLNSPQALHKTYESPQYCFHCKTGIACSTQEIENESDAFVNKDYLMI